MAEAVRMATAEADNDGQPTNIMPKRDPAAREITDEAMPTPMVARKPHALRT